MNVLPTERNTSDISQALEGFLTSIEDPMMKPFGKTNLIHHSDLANSDDWFRFIPGEAPTLLELGKCKNLSPLVNVIPEMIQGLRLNRQEPEMHPKTTMLSYDRPESTMMDSRIINETKRLVHVESVHTGTKAKIPKSVLILSTRTASGMDKILVDKTYDYMVANRFSSDAQFWDDQNPDEIIPKKQRQIDSRSCYLFAAGRGNIELTAPGTRLLAFCSKKLIAPTWAFWSMRSIPFEDACLLSLWWNSTYMLSQLIDIRTEVRGSRI